VKIRKPFGAAISVAFVASLLPIPGCAQPPKKDKVAGLEKPLLAAADAAVSASRVNAIVTASAKCSPAVVTVNTVQTVRRRVFPFFSTFEEKVPYMGSGFIFDPKGYVLTTEHVVHGADKTEVTLPDGRTLPAEWLGSDYERDVAVLKVEASDLPFVKLGDSSDLMIGEWAIAIGNPFGHVVASASPTVSVGVISALNRQMWGSGQGGFRYYEDLVQTDASINPGNSGGPLVNALGEAIGVNCTIITTSGGSLGIGFAVPINVAREAAQKIIAQSKTGGAWIGVYLVEVTPTVAKSFGLPNEEGLLIGYLDENTPAYRADIRRPRRHLKSKREER
jgi:serine protease Do